MYILFGIIHLLTVIEAFHDWFGLRQRQGHGDGTAWHILDAINWGIIATTIGYASVYGFGNATILTTVLLFAGCRWFVFSQIHTALRGKNFLYTGNTDLLDRALRLLPPYWSDSRRPTAFALRLAVYAASIYAYLS